VAALRITLSGASGEVRASRMVGTRGVRGVSRAHPNNGMHPTADTLPVIFGNGSGRRVMPGVRHALRKQKNRVSCDKAQKKRLLS
jgi:hypothetical protein